MGYAQTIPLSQLEFGTGLEAPFSVSNIAADHDFNVSIVLPSWVETGKIITAFIDYNVPYLRNLAGGNNYVDGSQYLQLSVNGGAYHNCTNFSNLSFWIFNGETIMSYMRVIGSINISSYLTNSGTLTFRWDNSKFLSDGVVFHNSWIVLRIMTN